MPKTFSAAMSKAAVMPVAQRGNYVVTRAGPGGNVSDRLVRLRKLTRRLRRWRATVALILAGAYLVAVAVLAGVGLHDRLAHADVIVVPGNTVARDGTPSPRLQARPVR